MPHVSLLCSFSHGGGLSPRVPISCAQCFLVRTHSILSSSLHPWSRVLPSVFSHPPLLGIFLHTLRSFSFTNTVSPSVFFSLSPASSPQRRKHLFPSLTLFKRDPQTVVLSEPKLIRSCIGDPVPTTPRPQNTTVNT